ncbi:hypothetical protein [Desulfosediminicola flagellatus]|uniref:hypothetical protein n=1 Tax=Desulfosediminicola flagellatus TaxID=2569541 RepID=UPI0010AD7832|nr:hypothetical protein [Desulfosediminicola flagellatus]
METLLIPHADTIPVSWGWFQFLLLLTFPLHLLAMNAMFGGLVLGVIQHFKGGDVQRRLAHRIAVVTPLLVAVTVNLGVAPYLFIQVLYGQFIYTSSILMGMFWIMIVPLLMLAYYGTYLYDFEFKKLGLKGAFIGVIASMIFFTIAAFFTNNMLLMVLPDRFGEYFNHMNGTLLIVDHQTFLPRYLHMVLGALAVGGLSVALLGRFQSDRDIELADHAQEYGMRAFLLFTVINIAVGVVYLMSLPREQMLLFMGKDMGATIAFTFGLLLAASVIWTAIKRKLWLTVGHIIALIFVMAFMRAWLRSGYLRDYFTLDQLQVVEQLSPMIFFFVTLLFGIACLGWLWRKTSKTLATT